MTIAVVMATYNGGRFIGEQLSSISRQTRRPDLLIVSDDGSSDETWEIVSEFARSAPFEVRLLRGPGRGLAWNFWTAARESDCSLIAWSDQDDIWRPTKLGRCEDALRSGAVDFVSHSALTVDDNGRSLRRRYPSYRATRALAPLHGDPWHVPSGFASMFRASLLREIDFDERPRSHQTGRTMNHDHVVSLRAFAFSRRLQIADVLAEYRQHTANAAGNPTETGLAAVRATIRPRAEQFSDLAGIAREHGEFVAGLGGGPDAAAYFGRLEHICQQRARIYRATSRRGALGELAEAAQSSVYASRSRGGFGLRGLIRDAGLSAARSAISA